MAISERDWQPMLRSLLKASHHTEADELGLLLRDHAQEYLGVVDATLYLCDYQQTELLPVPGPGDPQPFAIEGTMGGRAFTGGEIVVANDHGVHLMWVPVVNGTERLGVLGLTVTTDAGISNDACEALASMAAELVVSKGQYSDVFFRSRRTQEMALAAEMQWHLLPPLTFVTPRVTVAGGLEPAYEVGGDAFDFALNGNIMHVTVVDAMGHGVRASLMATAVIGAYRHIRRRGGSLAETFNAMDAVVRQQFPDDTFVTAQLGELDCLTGTFTWMNGGHPRPLLIRDGQVVQQLECAPTLPAGLSMGITEIKEEKLQPLDRLLFYTDGIIEAKSTEGAEFGLPRLIDFVERASLSGYAAPELLRRLTRAVYDHHDGKLQDDATFMLLEWRGDNPRHTDERLTRY